MAKAYLLTEADRNEIRKLIAEERRRYGGTAQRPHLEGEDYQTPEVYVAKTPVDVGIPSRVDAIPGWADCYVYRLLLISGDYTLSPVSNLTKRIYNLSDSVVDADIWVLAIRDKFGKWFLASAGGGNTEYTSGRITGHGTSPADPNAHSWVEIEQGTEGVWADVVDGESGDANAEPPVNPAYVKDHDLLFQDPNDATNYRRFPIGTRVQLWPGAVYLDPVTEEEVQAYWMLPRGLHVRSDPQPSPGTPCMSGPPGEYQWGVEAITFIGPGLKHSVDDAEPIPSAKVEIVFPSGEGCEPSSIDCEASAGSGEIPARWDHVHDLVIADFLTEGPGIVLTDVDCQVDIAVDFGGAPPDIACDSSAGVALTAAPSDHTHGIAIADFLTEGDGIILTDVGCQVDISVNFGETTPEKVGCVGLPGNSDEVAHHNHSHQWAIADFILAGTNITITGTCPWTINATGGGSAIQVCEINDAVVSCCGFAVQQLVFWGPSFDVVCEDDVEGPDRAVIKLAFGGTPEKIGCTNVEGDDDRPARINHEHEWVHADFFEFFSEDFTVTDLAACVKRIQTQGETTSINVLTNIFKTATGLEIQYRTLSFVRGLLDSDGELMTATIPYTSQLIVTDVTCSGATLVVTKKTAKYIGIAAA